MYTPKNRIVTNQYTSGNLLVDKTTQEFYRGFYYKTFNGKYFSGKTPNDTPSVELEFVQSTDSNYNDSLPQNELAYGDAPTYLDDINSEGYNQETVIKYAKMKGINLNNIPRVFVPTQHYPQPTEDDYKLGVFTRYFVVKTNEIQYMELSKDIYDKIKNKDIQYMWEPYTPFKLQWTIKGDEKYVVNTNRNIILLTEKRLKRQGLDIFLRKNYTKFWISE